MMANKMKKGFDAISALLGKKIGNYYSLVHFMLGINVTVPVKLLCILRTNIRDNLQQRFDEING